MLRIRLPRPASRIPPAFAYPDWMMTGSAQASMPEVRRQVPAEPEVPPPPQFSRWLGTGHNTSGALAQGYGGTLLCDPQYMRNGPEDIVDIAMCEGAVFALTAAGEVWDAGFNGFDELGRFGKNTTPQLYALAISLGRVEYLSNGGGSGVAAFPPRQLGVTSSVAVGLRGGSGGSPLGCAVLLDDTSVKVWGENAAGELGNGGQNIHLEHAELGGGQYPIPLRYDPAEEGAEAGQIAAGIVAIAAAEFAYWFLKSDGSIWYTGKPKFLGTHAYIKQLFPAGTFASKPVAIFASLHFQGCLLEDGTPRLWGDNQYGELGSGHEAGHSPNAEEAKEPHQPLGIGGEGLLGESAGGRVVQMCLMNRTSVALLADGTVATWGRNNLGQLGNGEHGEVNRLVPERVAGIEGAVEISASSGEAIGGLGGAGDEGVLVRTAAGVAMGWSKNTQGTLGVGDILPHFSPVVAYPEHAGEIDRVRLGIAQSWIRLKAPVQIGHAQLEYQLPSVGGQILVQAFPTVPQPLEVRWRPTVKSCPFTANKIWPLQKLVLPEGVTSALLSTYVAKHSGSIVREDNPLESGEEYKVEVKGAGIGSMPGAYGAKNAQPEPLQGNVEP